MRVTISSLLGCFAIIQALTRTAFAIPVDTESQLERRGGGGPPYFVIYADKFGGQQGPPPAAKLKGFNVIALSFLQTNQAMDKAAEWANFAADKRTQIKKEYEAAGIKVIVSLFGMMDKPTTQGVDPVKFGNTAADYVIKNGLDGVDVDYEDLDAFNKGDGKAEQWLIQLTKTLRQKLPKGKYLISHAPLAPWFSPTVYKGGGYLKVHKEAGDLIDFYMIQFYNQGADAYTSCPTLLTSSKFAGTSVFELGKAGVPLNKIVIGKPGAAADATNGFMDPKTLAGCVDQAKKQGWGGGIGAWQFPSADTNWITTARGSAFGAGAPAAKAASKAASKAAPKPPGHK